jgi:exonuclease VII large subunit
MLARGWTITRAADGSVIRSPDVVNEGDVITTEFASGRLASRAISSPDTEPHR